MRPTEIEILEMDQGKGKIYLGPEALAHFCATISGRSYRVFLLMDENTARDCAPILENFLQADASLVLPAGERHKDLAHCAQVWEALSLAKFERGDMLINLGGGVVCDLGGFAASTYKRGIRFGHIPTTLLAMADAAIGGKTGIDFMGFKNQVGSFQQPDFVVIHPAFLQTLDAQVLRAGYAEVLKHFLIHDRDAWQSAATGIMPLDWEELIPAAIRTKLYFTEADPEEKSIRKALNFGHTIGHGIESYFLQRTDQAPILHGEAVAAGMWCESYLSGQLGLLSPDEVQEIQRCIDTLYPKLHISTADIADIAGWCLQDKKNSGGQIKAVLLNNIGNFKLDQVLTLAQICESLQQYSAYNAR